MQSAIQAAAQITEADKKPVEPLEPVERDYSELIKTKLTDYALTTNQVSLLFKLSLPLFLSYVVESFGDYIIYYFESLHFDSFFEYQLGYESYVQIFKQVQLYFTYIFCFSYVDSISQPNTDLVRLITNDYYRVQILSCVIFALISGIVTSQFKKSKTFFVSFVVKAVFTPLTNIYLNAQIPFFMSENRRLISFSIPIVKSVVTVCTTVFIYSFYNGKTMTVNWPSIIGVIVGYGVVGLWIMWILRGKTKFGVRNLTVNAIVADTFKITIEEVKSTFKLTVVAKPTLISKNTNYFKTIFCINFNYILTQYLVASHFYFITSSNLLGIESIK
ncbi:Transmembrane_domain-containing protein [Hexamita inflata]|uniref:Transmembrane_domain-containing protein n=1 Tax=Hexamita inflata TaxID=28002 RepID=A0ABP1H9B1_9EUKA